MFWKGSLTIFAILYIHTGLAQYRDVSQLITDLQNEYRKDVLPTRTADSYVAVKVYPAIVRINNLDANNEEISSMISLSLSWTDDRLEWNPSTYGGVRKIYMPASSIWLPDISVYNTVSPPEPFRDQLVEVSSLGSVLYVRNVNARSYCHMDLEWYPRDQHTCEIIFSSWIYPSQKMLMEFMHVNTSYTDIPVLADTDKNIINLDNHQWQLVARKARAEIKLITYACCPEESYIQLKFILTVQRNTSLFKLFTDMFLLPMIVFTILVPFQFLLPCKSSARPTLGILLVFGEVLSLNVVCVNVPEYSDFPVVGIINTVCILQTTFALVLSIITSRIHGFSKERIPKFLQKVMKTSNSKRNASNEYQADQAGEEEDPLNIDFTTKINELNITSVDAVSINTTLLNISKELKHLNNLINSKCSRHVKSYKSRWQLLTAFLDKVLFIAFLVLSVVMVISIFFVLMS